MRFGTHYLPEDHAARMMLTALLCFDLTDDSAIECAPWCGSELATVKHTARRIKWRDIGKLISLTFDEWRTAKLWVTRPIDKSESELEAWREQRRKESSRKSKQKARAAEKQKAERTLAKARPSLRARPPSSKC